MRAPGRTVLALMLGARRRRSPGGEPARGRRRRPREAVPRLRADGPARGPDPAQGRRRAGGRPAGPRAHARSAVASGDAAGTPRRAADEGAHAARDADARRPAASSCPRCCASGPGTSTSTPAWSRRMSGARARRPAGPQTSPYSTRSATPGTRCMGRGAVVSGVASRVMHLGTLVYAVASRIAPVEQVLARRIVEMAAEVEPHRPRPCLSSTRTAPNRGRVPWHPPPTMCAVLVAAFAASGTCHEPDSERGPSAMGGTLDLLAAPAHDLERPFKAGDARGRRSGRGRNGWNRVPPPWRGTCAATWSARGRLAMRSCASRASTPARTVRPSWCRRTPSCRSGGETSEVVAEEAGPSLTYEPAPPDLAVLGCSRGRWSTGCGSR